VSDARSIAADVRSGRATARATISAYLERIDRSPLNAFTLVDHEGALAGARLVDDQLAAGHDPGPLAGVPIAVKDLIDQAGLPNTAGSSFYRVTPDQTAIAVARLEQAGGIAVGRTGLHEFAFGFSSENHWFGAVRNPWNPDTSPGGSSGGSGAAVAADLAAVGLGTDTGGSVRVPAALCGVVGLKVTHGRIPISGVFPLAPSIDTVGPLTRSVGDAALLYSLMAGGHAADPWSAFAPVEPVGPALDPAGLRVGVPDKWIEGAPMSAPVIEAFDALMTSLGRAGAQLISVELPEMVSPEQLTASAYGEIAGVHRRFRAAGKPYGPEVERRMKQADAVTLDEYLAGLAWRARIRQSAAVAFQQVDFVITPATGVMTKTIGQNRSETSAGDVHYRAALSWFSAPVNHAALPALVVPLSGPGAPPPALQVVAPWWQEHRLLEFGKFLETADLSAVRTPPDAR
jgi:aspartyl-tRNA(Asn)/glutamyl-tRNA(Gln) amidotransferase subunit A